MGRAMRESYDPLVCLGNPLATPTVVPTPPAFPRKRIPRWTGDRPSRRAELIASGGLDGQGRLRYRQADQKVAATILEEVPQDISLEEVYGLERVPALPVVERAVKKASFDSRR